MSLAALRAKLQAQDNRSQQNQQSSKRANADTSIYAHWNLPEGASSTLRFLPDADPNNVYFWVERQMLKLPFVGIKNQSESKEVTVQVPCIEMYSESEKCPVLAEVRTWYKDKSLEEMANRYWKKRSYLLQGFVRQNGLSDDQPPENPIRRFIITPQIFKNIRKSLLDPDFDIMPSDYQAGLDFKVVRSKNPGGYADWSTSDWAFMKGATALSEAERAAIDLHGLFDLKEFLPKKPSESELRIIREMFEASVDGRPYDPDKWGAYYKPWGLQTSGTASDDSEEDAPRPAMKVQPKTTVVSEDTSPPWEESPAKQASKLESASVVDTPPAAKAAIDKQDILAMIRSRQAKSA